MLMTMLGVLWYSSYRVKLNLCGNTFTTVIPAQSFEMAKKIATTVYGSKVIEVEDFN